MSETTVIQQSERIVSLILKALLENGIRYGTMLTIDHLDFEPTIEDQDVFKGCCIWLLDEEIIRCSNMDQVRKGTPMVNPVITAHGFSLLGEVFLSNPDERLGDAVRNVAEGSRNYSGFGDFVGGLLGGFTKSINS